MTYTDPITGETWRFDVTTHLHQSTPTITRGRAYRLPEAWTTDSWRNYWDGDCMVAFIDGGYRNGTYAVTEGDDTERAITAYRWSGTDALVPLAKRIAMADGATASTDTRFIHVSLDRGSDLYALSWGGDPAGEWRDEIEAVYNGDIWRIEVEEWNTFTETWQAADEECEEFYGEEKATAALAAEFPLAEVPDALLVTSEN